MSTNRRQHNFASGHKCSHCFCRPEHAAETLCKRVPMEQQRLAATQRANAFYSLSGSIYYRRDR